MFIERFGIGSVCCQLHWIFCHLENQECHSSKLQRQCTMMYIRVPRYKYLIYYMHIYISVYRNMLCIRVGSQSQSDILFLKRASFLRGF